MGSSLNNTDTSYRDSDEIVYEPYDTFCHYMETISNKGELNTYSVACTAKLALEEIPHSCKVCKGLVVRKKPTKNPAVKERQTKYQEEYRKKKKAEKEYIDKDTFNDLYWDKSMPLPAIAEKINVPHQTLVGFVKRQGYKLRTKKEASILRENKQQKVKRNAEHEK